jgi:hypothetical protein
MAVFELPVEKQQVNIIFCQIFFSTPLPSLGWCYLGFRADKKGIFNLAII